MEKNARCTKIDWCEVGLQFSDIGTNNVSETDLTPRMKCIMVRIEKWRQKNCTRVVIEYRTVSTNKSSEWLD